MQQITAQSKIKRTQATLQSVVLVLALLLLGAHIMISKSYTKVIWENRGNPYVQFHVFVEDAYPLFAFSLNDVGSRINMLYALFHPANINIPSINFDRLTASLRGTMKLDPLNIQPYLTITYYWSWAKSPEARASMAEFMRTGLDRFPEMWEIPYTLYMLTKADHQEESIAYIRLAAERAAEFGGPDWIVDYPAILMTREGEGAEALLWLNQTLSVTENEKQRALIEEQMEKIQRQLDGVESYQQFEPLKPKEAEPEADQSDLSVF